MKYLILILPLIVSCGEDSTPQNPGDVASYSGCTTKINSVVAKTWTSDSNNTVINLTGCTIGNTCYLCDDPTCNAADDVRITYRSSGTITLKYFNNINLNNMLGYSANWKVCDGVLSVTNKTQGADETWR